jgi:site-specific DNA-methyltransferase (adenine-specific)
MKAVTGKQMKTVWTMSAPKNGEKALGKHPTQKPLALVERCLLASTNQGDTVLDPFLGGGTTAVACVQVRRQFYGVELDETHLRLSSRRADREIITLWLSEIRIAMRVESFSRSDLDLFPETINGSLEMDKAPEIQTERIYQESKFVFLSCAEVTRASVVHTTVNVSLQDAWVSAPTGKKRETTHIVRCETEILRVKTH